MSKCCTMNASGDRCVAVKSTVGGVVQANEARGTVKESVVKGGVVINEDEQDVAACEHEIVVLVV